MIPDIYQFCYILILLDIERVIIIINVQYCYLLHGGARHLALLICYIF